MAKPLVPGPSRLEVKIAIAKLIKYSSPGSDQIPAELIQVGDEILLSVTHKLTMLSTSYKILLNILLSRLSPYIDEIIGDYQRGFRCNRSTTNQIFCIRLILEKMGVQ
jgi:hypothetical protein